MNRKDALEIAYKRIRDDYYEYSGIKVNMTWNEQRDINREIWNNTPEKDRDNFYSLNDKYVYDALSFYGKIPYKINTFLKVLDINEKILDFGCGSCSDILALRLLGYNVDGYDVDSEHVRFGKWRLNKYGVDTKGNIYFDFPTSKYDFVYSYDVIEHIKNWKEAITLICSVGNRLMLSWKFDDDDGLIPYHYRHDSSEVMSFIESYGFVRIKSSLTKMPRMPRLWIKK